jgi:uncharacterized protein YjbJ (UPF0337 family)
LPAKLEHIRAKAGTRRAPFPRGIQNEEVTVWNRDEVHGKTDQVKGKVKQAVGDLKDDDRLRDEGTEDEAAGQVEEAIGKGRRKVGEAISDLGKKVGR